MIIGNREKDRSQLAGGAASHLGRTASHVGNSKCMPRETLL